MPLEDPGSVTPGQQPVFRVDGAHRLGDRGGTRGQSESAAVHQEVAELAASAAAVPGFSAPAYQGEQLQVQAEQLARHLQERRRDIDYREAQVNARIAQLENELRLSRLWLQEQHYEFSEREEQLKSQLAEQEKRAADLVTHQLALDESRRQLSDELRTREESLARREFEVLESQQRLSLESTRLIQARENLELARKQVDESRQVALHRDVADQLAQLRLSQQEQLSAWHQEQDAALRRLAERESALAKEGENLAAQARQSQQERQQQLQSLEEQRLKLDQRQLAVERIRSEMLQLHRESLEMRLIAEQLWAELVEQASPTEVTAGMSRLRSKLADTFRLATSDLDRQRQTIQELTERLDAKHRDVVSQRQVLLAWFADRQRELAQQAATLRDRESELSTAERNWQEERDLWHRERRQMQCEIAELQASVLRLSAANPTLGHPIPPSAELGSAKLH